MWIRKNLVVFSLLCSLRHENKMMTADSRMAAVVTSTTAHHSLFSSGLLFLLFMVRGKNNKISHCASKQEFFRSGHSCDPKDLLPLLFSPFPVSNQPSFLGPCASCCLQALFFFPFTFFSPSPLVSGHCRPSSFPWLNQQHSSFVSTSLSQ